MEHVAGCIGKSRSKAENLLKFLFRIERDDLGGTLSGGLPPGKSRRAFEAPLLIGYPHADLGSTKRGGAKGSPSWHCIGNGTGGQSSAGYSQKVASRILGGHFCLSKDQESHACQIMLKP